jgi:ornithine decarboxylase
MFDRLAAMGGDVAAPTSAVSGSALTTAAMIDGGTYARVLEFLDLHPQRTPCLVVDLETVKERYWQLRAALPCAEVFYAVKANPAREIVALLAQLGSGFDVASRGEIDLCLDEGARPETISYGNTIKKSEDVAYAYARGVRLFTSDSEQDLDNIARWAPGSSVFCRILVDSSAARSPFGRKFGSSVGIAVDLLARAQRLGLDPCGVSFHVGSQQLDPTSWDAGIAAAARIASELEHADVTLTALNLGGGLPGARYRHTAPGLAAYVTAIQGSLGRHFGAAEPRVIIEPGRSLVADAGVIRTEVVLVARKSYVEERRWVYLDVGRYRGLAETEGEAIAYRLVTSKDGAPVGPVVLAGPTCDGDDVLYQHTRYELPLDLCAGDHIDILSAGAYTASYSSVAFNGFEPMSTYCIPTEL